MPNKHRRTPRSLRLTEGDEAWLVMLAAETGRPVNAIVQEAVTHYRQRYEMAGKEIVHKDGDPLNNDITNLEIRKASK